MSRVLTAFLLHPARAGRAALGVEGGGEGPGMMTPEELRAFARSVLDGKLRAGWRKESILRTEYEGFTGPSRPGYLISAGKISVCQESQYLTRHTDEWAVTFRMADLLREGAARSTPATLPAQLDLFA